MAQNAISFVFGPFRLLAARHELLAQGVPVTIGQRALDVLLALVRRHGELVTKDELMSAVWPGLVVEENNLAVHISALRKILGKTEDGKSYLQTVAGRGYRFVAPVTQEDVARAVVPPVVPVEPKGAPHNLPQMLTRLIGRSDELGVLQEHLKRHRLVTLTAGGVGKTRLAIETGRQALPSYPDGVWFIDLAPIRGLVAALVAEVLGLGHASGSAGSLAAVLKGQQRLIILDNCEHVIGESAALAETLIRTCPDLSILATSRERLAIAGENVFRVPSLPTPDATDALTAQAAQRFGAVEMFVERAAALGEGFALTNQNAAVVAAICRRIDGIPLAIELAAPRLRVLSERQLASGLDERFGLLTGGSRTAVPRHQTLQALIAWSYELLDRTEQQMLRRFAVCAGSTSLASIVAVAEPDAAHADVLDLVISLVEKSLILPDRDQDETRYRMPESTRYFALDRLAAEEQHDRHRRHARYFAERFAQATQAFETSASESWLSRYGADVDNLRTALTFAFGPDGSRDIALDLVGCSHVIWSELGLMLEHRHWVERARACVTADTPPLTQARLLSWQSGDVKDADDPSDIDDALSAASLYRGLGDAFHEGKMLMRAGAGRLMQDSAQTSTPADHDSGESLLRTARALLAPSGDTKALAQCVSALASARLFADDMGQAQALHREALAITQRLAETEAVAASNRSSRLKT
ncbi:winged helix-turn-helix domain-containing protein [Bradyrhizobium sp. INPA03-11B]|uniref:ATP-binding protein n=1 Tax=Bradyrhizobium sp. INPA03-11B TaxID=418598 RepID=UPI00338E1CDE